MPASNISTASNEQHNNKRDMTCSISVPHRPLGLFLSVKSELQRRGVACMAAMRPSNGAHALLVPDMPFSLARLVIEVGTA